MNKYLAIVIVGCLTLVVGCGALDHPAYRPAAEGDAVKLLRQRLGKTSITVLPTVIRSLRGSAYDKASRGKIADFFKTDKLATVIERDDQVDLSKSRDRVQRNLFRKCMSLLADHVKTSPVATDYVLLVECLVTPRRSGGQAVGGIQCYLLDSKGHNAFSFLLNSHHRLFNEAQLKRKTVSDDTHADLIDQSTEVVIEALRSQLRSEAAR